VSLPPDEATHATAPDGESGGEVSSGRRTVSPGVLLADRFDVEEKLGEGGMGQVFAAFDRARQTRVAVKTLGRLTPQSIAQMKREFRTAAELVHPNLVRLHELFSDGIEWFFTMDLVDGTTLARLLGDAPAASSDRFRNILWQLASALRTLHRAGAIHGDLKPSNFLITGPGDRVILLDFGLSRPLGPTQDREFAGTPAYMAPEQAMGEILTEAADWYAFGVVLYEALTGELPFRKPSRRRLEGAPEDLSALCLRLLSLGPTDRPSGDEVLLGLGSPDRGEEYSTSPPPSRRLSLFGRSDELSELRVALGRARDGLPSMALVHGPSGIGKTALLERFITEARVGGALVLTGRCRERESMGYKAVDGLIDDIVRLLDDLDDAEAAALLPEDIGDLTILFPALLAARAIAQAKKQRIETPDQSVARQRAVAAFRELVERLRKRSELVIWIDDLQWSDGESALLLGRTLGGLQAVPLLLVGSYRSDSAGRGPLLDALLGDRTTTLPEPTEIALGPLCINDAERLALELLPPESADAAAIARSIGREAGGHPLFIAELSYSAETASRSVAPRPEATLSELVSRRVAALPEPARRLLEAAAVAGTPLSRGVLRETQGFAPAEAQTAIDILRANRLVRSNGLREEDAVDLHHDRIREIVVEGLGDADRKHHHLVLARVLEARPETKPDVLASHYQAAGDLVRAGRYWLAGADVAFHALAFEHAAELYEKAARKADLGARERRAMQVRRAEALAYAGKGPAAANMYLAIASSCVGSEALELRRRAAEQLLLSGHLAHGLGLIEQVLGATGMRRSRGGRRALLSLVLGRLRVRARGLQHVVRPERDVPPEELSRVDASWTIACSLGVVDFMRGAEFQTEHLLLALRAGEPRRVLRALTLEVTYAATPGAGSERRTTHLLGIADRLAQQSGDDGAMGLLGLSRGIAAYLQERLETAVTHFEDALDILTTRCSGTVWEIVTAQRFLNASLFFLGRFKRLEEIVPKLLSDAEGKGNIYASMCFRTAYTWPAWLVRGDVEETRRQLARAREEWPMGGYQLSNANFLIGDTLVDFYTGDAERPLARIREEWPKIEESQLLRIGILRVQLRQLRAASAVVAARAAEARGSRAEARELRGDARKYARLLRGERIRRAAPLAELVDAALDRAEGNVDGARRRLATCVKVFGDHGLRLFSAAATVRLGELTSGSNGQSHVERGLAEFHREGVVDPGRMIDMLAPGFR
jgi:tetratricopeptide (TPR) repeat protein